MAFNISNAITANHRVLSSPYASDEKLFNALVGQDNRALKDALDQGANPNELLMLTSYLYKLNHFDSDYYESQQDGNSELFALSVMAYLLPPTYYPPLYYAILNRDIDAVKLLIDYGGDIHTKPKMDWTRTGHFVPPQSLWPQEAIEEYQIPPVFEINLETDEFKLEVAEMLHAKGMPIEKMIFNQTPQELLQEAMSQVELSWKNDELIEFLQNHGFCPKDQSKALQDLQ